MWRNRLSQKRSSQRTEDCVMSNSCALLQVPLLKLIKKRFVSMCWISSGVSMTLVWMIGLVGILNEFPKDCSQNQGYVCQKRILFCLLAKFCFMNYSVQGWDRSVKQLNFIVALNLLPALYGRQSVVHQRAFASQSMEYVDTIESTIWWTVTLSIQWEWEQR